MEALKNDDEDMYDCLTPFLKEVQGGTSTSSGQQYNCLSYKSIPFCLSRELGEKLALPYSDRFNIESNTCQLFSDNTCQCCEPSAKSTFSTKLKTAKIVLPNKLLNAIGMCMMVIQYEIMFLLCVIFSCQQFMLVCVQDVELLNNLMAKHMVCLTWESFLCLMRYYEPSCINFFLEGKY